MQPAFAKPSSANAGFGFRLRCALCCVVLALGWLRANCRFADSVCSELPMSIRVRVRFRVRFRFRSLALVALTGCNSQLGSLQLLGYDRASEFVVLAFKCFGLTWPRSGRHLYMSNIENTDIHLIRTKWTRRIEKHDCKIEQTGPTILEPIAPIAEPTKAWRPLEAATTASGGPQASPNKRPTSLRRTPIAASVDFFAN